MEQQQKKIQSLKGVVASSIVGEAMGEVVKGAEMTMQNALLMQQTYHLQSENQYRKKRKQKTQIFHSEWRESNCC